MKISGVNPDTGEVYKAEADQVDNNFINSMLDFKLSDEDVRKLIDNLNISADAKSLIYTFSKAIIKAGDIVLKIGRKIIDFVCMIFNEYPNATFGVVFGAIVGFLMSSIPVLGVVLGPISATIFISLGFIFGAKEDIKDKGLARKIAEANAKFSPLKANE